MGVLDQSCPIVYDFFSMLMSFYQIYESDVENYFQWPEDATCSFPHSLLYNVDGSNKKEELDLEIRVENSHCCGKEVSFLLKSTTASPRTGM